MNVFLPQGSSNAFVFVWQKLEPVVIIEENVQRIEWVVKPFEGLKEFPDALLLKVALIGSHRTSLLFLPAASDEIMCVA